MLGWLPRKRPRGRPRQTFGHALQYHVFNVIEKADKDYDIEHVLIEEDDGDDNNNNNNNNNSNNDDRVTLEDEWFWAAKKKKKWNRIIKIAREIL